MIITYCKYLCYYVLGANIHGCAIRRWGLKMASGDTIVEWPKGGRRKNKVRAEKQCQIMWDNKTLTMPLLSKQIGDKRKRLGWWSQCNHCGTCLCWTVMMCDATYVWPYILTRKVLWHYNRITYQSKKEEGTHMRTSRCWGMCIEGVVVQWNISTPCTHEKISLHSYRVTWPSLREQEKGPQKATRSSRRQSERELTGRKNQGNR